MLSSKKSALIHRLLKKFTSDVNSNLQPTSSTTGGNCHHMAGNKSPLINQFNLLWSYLLSNCCCAGSQISYNLNITHPTSPIIEEATNQLRRLSKHKLQHLWEVIQSGGRVVGKCVLVPKHTNSCDEQHSSMVQHNDIDLRLLVILLWRWPRDSIDHRRLRSLPWCDFSDLGWDDIAKQQVCINPYHWSLLSLDFSHENVVYGQEAPKANHSSVDDQLKRDCQLVESQSNQYYPMPSSTPPPSYSEANSPLLSVRLPRNWDSSKSIGPDNERGSTWCRLLYWEKRSRVGKQFSVTTKWINVSADPVDGNNLCLNSLFHHNKEATKDIHNTRDKIGLGVSLFRDNDNCVWLYNRSSSDIFVNSLLTFNFGDSKTVKLHPGQVIKAYDYKAALKLRQLIESTTHTSANGLSSSRLESLLKSNSFRFSFAKGFGENYHREDIIYCPCWLEVIIDFANPMKPVTVSP